MADWLPAMAAAYGAARIDPSLVAATTAVGVAEGLLAGVTTVADHQLNWPAGYGDAGRGYGLADLARAVAAGEPHRASGDVALHVLEITEAVAASSASGTVVTLVTAPDVPRVVPLGAEPHLA